MQETSINSILSAMKHVNHFEPQEDMWFSIAYEL